MDQGPRKSGITLVEILVVIGVSIIVFGYVLGVGSEFYGSQALVAERDSFVSLLKSARIKAMSNVGESDHGVFIDGDEYVIFEGDSYAGRNADFDETFPRMPGATITGPSEIVFTALEGSAGDNATVTIASGVGEVEVSINREGRIGW